GILVGLKPTLAVLALIGVRRGTWWLAAACLGLIAAASVGLWLDYFTVLGTTRRMGLDYSLGAIPLICAPIVLWIGRSRDERDRTEAERPSQAITGMRRTGTSFSE